MPEVKNKIKKNHITRIRRTTSSKPKGVDTLKYCGKIKLNEDALDIQNKIRNEWQ